MWGAARGVAGLVAVLVILASGVALESCHALNTGINAQGEAKRDAR